MNFLFFAYYVICSLIIVVISTKVSIWIENDYVGILLAGSGFIAIRLMRISWCVHDVSEDILFFCKKNGYDIVSHGKLKHPELIKERSDYVSTVNIVPGSLMPHGNHHVYITLSFFSKKYPDIDFCIHQRDLLDIVSIKMLIWNPEEDAENLFLHKVVFDYQTRNYFYFLRDSIFQISLKEEELTATIRGDSAYTIDIYEVIDVFQCARRINDNLLKFSDKSS